MKKLWILISAIMCFSAAQVMAQEAKQHEFTGAAKCKTCHRTAAQGEQFKIWEEGPHAKAYAVLAGDAAKKIAAEKGLGDAQKAEACLTCHVTGHGVDKAFLGTKYDMTEGVTCESCHGAGGDYYRSKTMKAVMSGEVTAESVGLIIPTKDVCVTCHNDKSPTFKGFDFAKYSEKIAHPMPAERKAKYKE